ncbi:MAG: hypothetical protein E7213_00575 [Clostridium sp.]|nr:hypothetical protein [Clostridium sp.]
MRPKKLVMSAFGPYAKEEVIDFSLLNGKNIFLITGTTGAGKTTIFDAISYALFGEASGSSRENESLRSDFADINRLTYVELDFELKGETYHIRRVPQQMKPKVKGEGFTHQGSEAELILPDGKVRTGTSNVTNKINELLGITKEQFKQIVMLPQGEFKKLLLADSKEREVIFRKIFGTYNYEKIQLLLNDKAKKIYKDLEKSKDSILVNLKNIKSENINIDDKDIDLSGTVAKIEEEIDIKKKDNAEIEQKLTIIRKNIEKFQTEKIQGITSNSLLQEKVKVQALLEDYKKQEINIKVKEDNLVKLNKAKEIVFIEDEISRVIRNRQIKEKLSLEISNNIQVIQNELEKAKVYLLSEEGKEEEKNKNIELRNSLNEKKPKIIEFDNKKSNVSKLTTKIKGVKESLENEQKNLQILKEDKVKNEENIKNISELEKQKILIDKEAQDKQKLIQEIRNLYKAIQKLKCNNEEYKKLNVDFKNKDYIYKINKADYENKQELYMKEQAGILASVLKDGQACPVCGSTNHPLPAVRINEVPTEEELNISKEKYEKCQKEYNEILVKMASLKSSIDSLKSDVIEKKMENLSEYFESIIYNDETEDKVILLGKKLRDEIEQLNSKLSIMNVEIVKKESLNEECEAIKNKIKNSETKITELNEIYTNDFASLKSDEEKIKSLEREIPEGISSIADLDDRILVLQEKIDLHDKRVKAARDKVNELNDKKASEISKFEEGKKILKEISIDIKEKNDLFNRMISESKFENLDEYNEVKKNIVYIDKIQNEISQFKEKLKSLSDRYIELKTKTEKLEFVDIKEIEDKISNEKKIEEDISQKAKQLYSIIDNNVNTLKEIKKISDKVKEKESAYRIIGELANLANGKKSPYISFERFVLASYFQEIIDAANIRLSKMTGERFILKRKEDKSKGTSQQGLELEVYDNYTGKCRHVKTLSGGESFKAALSLALGLSDVVQANAGGISLDTIFIDEGFGTLDSESLDNAISSLIALQKGGRLVGIISHVPELKERIEAKLEIKSSLEGSVAKFNFE